LTVSVRVLLYDNFQTTGPCGSCAMDEGPGHVKNRPRVNPLYNAYGASLQKNSEKNNRRHAHTQTPFSRTASDTAIMRKGTFLSYYPSVRELR
jgi:hypothetical protein